MNIIYTALPMRAQTEKTTFSSKDDKGKFLHVYWSGAKGLKTSPPSARVAAMRYMQQQNCKKLQWNISETPMKLFLQFYWYTLEITFFKFPENFPKASLKLLDTLEAPLNHPWGSLETPFTLFETPLKLPWNAIETPLKLSSNTHWTSLNTLETHLNSIEIIFNLPWNTLETVWE